MSTEYIADCKRRKHVCNLVNGKVVGPEDAPLFVGPPQCSFKNPLPERKWAGVIFKLIGTDVATNCAVYVRDEDKPEPKKTARKPKRAK